MIFKLLSELSSCELKTVFRRAGKRGSFMESQAIVQLTIYLINIGQDPFTYRFPISVPEVSKVEATVLKVAEDSNLGVQNVAERSQETVDHDDVPEEEVLAGFPSGLADGVSAVSRNMPASEYSATSSFLFPVSSSLISTAVQSLVTSSSEATLCKFFAGLLDMSSETSVCTEKSSQVNASGMKVSYLDMTLHLELWPPDLPINWPDFGAKSLF